MTSSEMKQPNVNDYVLAHPLALPFWVCGFVYLFFNTEGLFNPLLVMLLVSFWLHSLRYSLTAILEYHAAEEENEAGEPIAEPLVAAVPH